MDQGVVYLIIGKQHYVRLVVSLYTLRKHYSGEISILCPIQEKHETLELIAKDKRLKVNLQRMEFPPLAMDQPYVGKAMVYRYTPYKRTIFFDADTLVNKDIDVLWTVDSKITVVQMAEWTTQGKIMQRRIGKWEHVLPKEVKKARESAIPAINTGVFSFSAKTEILSTWERVVAQNPIHMCDEVGLQLLYPEYPYRILPDKFNCCPLQGKGKIEAVIWHFHGRNHLHPKAINLWLPAYQECIEYDIGGLRSWTPGGDIQLIDYLSQQGTKNA